MKKILTKKGFTLIELIVVIAILAILAAILIPSITNYITKANQAKNQADARSYYSAVVLEVATANPSLGTVASYLPTTAGSPCDTIAVAVTSGAVTSYSCTIDSVAYTSALNFVPSP